MNEEYYFTEDIDRELRSPQRNNNSRPDNYGLAIASMILGIISLVFFLFGLNFFTAIVSIILAIIFLASNARSASHKGRGMAITGIVTSVLSMAFFIGSIAFVMQNADNIMDMFQSEIEFGPGENNEFYFEYNFDGLDDLDELDQFDNNNDFDVDLDDTL